MGLNIAIKGCKLYLKYFEKDPYYHLTPSGLGNLFHFFPSVSPLAIHIKALRAYHALSHADVFYDY